MPVPDPAGGQDVAEVWRADAGEVGAALAGRRPNLRVEAMREALTVWNPFADELLELWLPPGMMPAWSPRCCRPAGPSGRGRCWPATRCSPTKENLAILRTATQEVTGGRPLVPRARGMLRRAVYAMLAMRGRPGSAAHAVLRRAQAHVAAKPAHHLLARIVVPG
ncbi:hypothetical protein ACN27G_15090 [Plantactinospora sp. WMMB334]|uniref:hypothetical protein n=1 Tax=Plantactinospora sp. WMMB334 TaxID=3404119 RepID=UPI003B92E922